MEQYHETILVVEDDVQIRNFICYALKAEGFRCVTAGNAATAMKQLLAEPVDMMLLDLGLPDMDGGEVLKKVREWSEMPIIIVSARDQDREKAAMLDLGADDYLTKPFGVMELIARVRALLRRSSDGKEEKKVLSLDELSMDDEKHAVYVNDKPCELTFKEYELLKMFLDNVGIVLTRESIMNRIWGTDYSGETRTVDMHIKTLRQKLGEAGNRIKTIRNVGYMLE